LRSGAKIPNRVALAPLTNQQQIEAAIGRFISAARRAQAAGFAGVELYAAHGYLLIAVPEPDHQSAQ
jgi:hypothetical protein